MNKELDFTPMRVRAYLSSPVLTDGYTPLDGALYYHFIRSRYGVKHRSTPLASEVKEYGGQSLPLLMHRSRKTQTKDWFYACSFAQWYEKATYGKHMTTRRFDIEGAMKYVDFGKGKGNVEVKKGPFKNYYFEDITISAPFVDWYLVGDIKAVCDLVAFITHIGKKGTGTVAHWKVEPFHADWSVRGYEDKRLMRAVPIKKENTPIYGIRPSYWHPRHQTRVVLPPVSFSAKE